MAIVVQVVSFAAVREAIGSGQSAIRLGDDATVGGLWKQLAAAAPELAALRASTRVARNGTLVDDACVLADGDEVALLPPVGGG